MTYAVVVVMIAGVSSADPCGHGYVCLGLGPFMTFSCCFMVMAMIALDLVFYDLRCCIVVMAMIALDLVHL